jgi:hypothetical protein
LVSFKIFRRPLFPKPISWLGLFFATSYNKTALAAHAKRQFERHKQILTQINLAFTNSVTFNVPKFD